jgi:hypothetical protein
LWENPIARRSASAARNAEIAIRQQDIQFAVYTDTRHQRAPSRQVAMQRDELLYFYYSNRPAVNEKMSGERQSTRDLRKRCFFVVAHLHAANPKKAALFRCFGDVLADLAQPAFECGRVSRRLRVEQLSRLP